MQEFVRRMSGFIHCERCATERSHRGVECEFTNRVGGRSIGQLHCVHMDEPSYIYGSTTRSLSLTSWSLPHTVQCDDRSKDGVSLQPY